MKHKKRLVFIIGIFISFAVFGQLPENDNTWQLIFNDDFTGTSVDGSIWDSNYPWNQRSYLLTCDLNNDGEKDTVYTENVGYRTWNFENCELDNGILKIISKQENYVGKVWDSWVWDDCYDPGVFQWCPVETYENFNYTTGMLISNMKIRYGYFEIRCKIPQPQVPHQTKGLGPNFWIWGGDCGYADYSEIDVFEFAGEYNDNGIEKVNMFTCNSHYNDAGGPGNEDWPIPEYFSINFDDYHIFSAEWGADRIIYYIDHIPVFVSDNPYPDDMCPLQIIVDINHPSTNFCDVEVPDSTVFPYI